MMKQDQLTCDNNTWMWVHRGWLPIKVELGRYSRYQGFDLIYSAQTPGSAVGQHASRGRRERERVKGLWIHALWYYSTWLEIHGTETCTSGTCKAIETLQVHACVLRAYPLLGSKRTFEFRLALHWIHSLMIDESIKIVRGKRLMPTTTSDTHRQSRLSSSLALTMTTTTLNQATLVLSSRPSSIKHDQNLDWIPR